MLTTLDRGGPATAFAVLCVALGGTSLDAFSRYVVIPSFATPVNAYAGACTGSSTDDELMRDDPSYVLPTDLASSHSVTNYILRMVERELYDIII